MTESNNASERIRHQQVAGPKGSSIFSILVGIWKQRSLVWEMTRRELTDMHAGQAAGIVWLIAHPLLQFMVYAFLFTIVFQVRIAGRDSSDYLVYLFSGLAPWLMVQDVLSRAPNIILANQSIVKKVMFSIEVLVFKSYLSSILIQSILLFCAFLYIFIAKMNIYGIYAMLPILIVMLLCLMWGLALLLSAITPFFRDTPEIVRIFVTINIYLLPILYLPDSIPRVLKFMLYVNPFSHVIWCFQDVLYFNSFQHPISWIVTFFFSFGALFIGSYLFSRLRHYFSSVL